MVINDIDIKSFDCKVERKMFDHASDEDSGLGALSVRLLFHGTTRENVHKNISNFMAINMQNCIIKFKNIKNYFNASYLDHSIEDTEFDEYLFLEIEFEYFEFGEEIKRSFISQSSIDIEGNMNTDVTVSITPKINFIDCILSGVTEDPITIKNLKANTTVIIDGIDGLVTEEGRNKFLEVDLWDFPSLAPGQNYISINKEDVKIEIKYTPKWR